MRQPWARAPLTLLFCLFVSGCTGDPVQPAAGNKNGTMTVLPDVLTCRGNEPFWALDVSAPAATLSTPESGGAVAVAFVGSRFDSGRWTLEGRTAEGELRLVLETTTCLDSMADHLPPAPYRASLALAGGRSGPGCCWVGPLPREGD